MKAWFRKYKAAMLLSFGIYIAAFAAVWGGVGPTTWVSASTTDYTPSVRTPQGRELVLIYIGSSGCVPSNSDDLPQMMQQITIALEERARRTDRAFTTIGIAKDWSVENGLTHLRKIGDFNEVTAGRNWLNTGIQRFVWDDMPGKAGTPQVVVVEWTVGKAAGLPRTLIYDETLLVRKVGLHEIERWLNAGAPLPTSAVP